MQWNTIKLSTAFWRIKHFCSLIICLGYMECLLSLHNRGRTYQQVWNLMLCFSSKLNQASNLALEKIEALFQLLRLLFFPAEMLVLSEFPLDECIVELSVGVSQTPSLTQQRAVKVQHSHARPGCHDRRIGRENRPGTLSSQKIIFAMPEKPKRKIDSGGSEL